MTKELTSIEIRNNHVTKMDMVVVFLEKCFGMKFEDAFEAMLDIHESGSRNVVVFDSVFKKEILERIQSLNDRLHHPLNYVAHRSVECTVAPYINAEKVLRIEVGDFPPKRSWLQVLFVVVSLMAVVTIAFWLWQRSMGRS